jgi:hypothetical protein
VVSKLPNVPYVIPSSQVKPEPTPQLPTQQLPGDQTPTNPQPQTQTPPQN